MLWPHALILAAFWGIVWALCLQFTEWGRWLALRRTWLTVVIGVGVDLLIVGLVVNAEAWLRVCSIVAVSSLGIIFRSLINEHSDDAQ